MSTPSNESKEASKSLSEVRTTTSSSSSYSSSFSLPLPLPPLCRGPTPHSLSLSLLFASSPPNPSVSFPKTKSFRFQQHVIGELAAELIDSRDWTMKQSPAQQPNRRAYTAFRSSAGGDGGTGASLDGSPIKSTGFFFWSAVHVFCCLLSAAAGFRFSRLLFLLIFSPAPPSSSTSHQHLRLHLLRQQPLTVLPSPPPPPPPPQHAVPPPPPPTSVSSRVVVGRHGIRVRPWPHPDPAEVARAHEILARVQQEQRLQYGVKNPRPIIVVTPTYARTFQALHLTGLLHSLMLVPYPLTWLVVEAGGVSNETASLLARSGLPVLHLPFREQMPALWSDRHRLEARMRLHALRVIRERRLDGIVVFADDSNVHNMELFNEIQKVEWMGAVSVGILAHSAAPDLSSGRQPREGEKENSPLPIQGPACNSSGHLIGWHTFNTLPYAKKAATYVGDGVTVLPMKLEWSGFVMNSRLLWKEAEGKPSWVRDLDDVGISGEEIESPLDLLKDASSVEPLGNCGKKVFLWWLRAEARFDSKFPAGWAINPPLEIIVPAKRTPWPEAPPDLAFGEQIADEQDHVEIQTSKKSRSPRSKRSSRKKKKHEPHVDTQISDSSSRQEK
ncbi:putative glucuronosyltransferase [Canna indica]|uniref:Glycosyltransferases n=1 Tax=Canna indica TaxID=4628 RepID=A0AAQ3Q599_9LILI|nr:putative glucuronosyltransferase [Canna indica]